MAQKGQDMGQRSHRSSMVLRWMASPGCLVKEEPVSGRRGQKKCRITFQILKASPPGGLWTCPGPAVAPTGCSLGGAFSCGFSGSGGLSHRQGLQFVLLSPHALCVGQSRSSGCHARRGQGVGLGTQQVLTKDRWLGHVLYEDCQPPYTATCIFPLGLIVYPLSTRTSVLPRRPPVCLASGEGRKPRAHVSALPLTGRGTLPLGSSDVPAMSGNNQMCPSGYGEGWRKCRCNSVSVLAELPEAEDQASDAKYPPIPKGALDQLAGLQGSQVTATHI